MAAVRGMTERVSSGRPRIRSIKPEVWADERIGELSRDARLLFIGLITMADDEGRLRGLPAAILGHVFPWDADALKRLPAWLAEVETSGLIVRYEHEGRPYIAIPNFAHHQRIDRPSASALPPPPAFTGVPVPGSSNGRGLVDDESQIDRKPVVDRSRASRAPADRIGSDQDQHPPLTPPAAPGGIVIPTRPVGGRSRDLATYRAALTDLARDHFPDWHPEEVRGGIETGRARTENELRLWLELHHPRAHTAACADCEHGTVVGPNGERWRCNTCGGLGRTTPTDDDSHPAQDRKEPAWS